MYAKYEKAFKKENYLFQKHLQISLQIFFHNSYIFSFIHQKRFHKNQNFNFPAKTYEIPKVIGNKIVYFKKIYNFSLEHFL